MDSKVFMLPDGRSSYDPNLLLTSMMSNGGFGGGNWIWVIFLFLLFGRNGFGWGDNGLANVAGTGYLSNLISNDSGRELLMQAINGNGTAVANLANMLNSDINSIKSAINAVQGAISSVGTLVGMSAADVKNAITTGNMSLALQLAQCCCDNKLLVTTLGYENLIATLNLTNALQNAINNNTVQTQEGFTTVTFLNQTQLAATQRAISDGVQGIKDATNALTASIISKLDAIEDARKDREINTLTAQLSAVTAKAEREAELAPIVKQLDAIQCKQPSTITTQYSPFVAVPNCVAYQGLYNAMLYGLNPYNTGNGSIWS